MPRIPFMGVRISWDILARNSDLALLNFKKEGQSLPDILLNKPKPPIKVEFIKNTQKYFRHILRYTVSHKLSLEYEKDKVNKFIPSKSVNNHKYRR